MGSNWRQVTLKDVLGDKGYIRGPFGSSLRRNELSNEGIPVYEQQHAIYNTRTFRYFIHQDKFRELKRFVVKENDLIISCSGTLGRVSMIRSDDPKGIISQALLILRPDTNYITPQYLYYFLTSLTGYNSLVTVSSGSVQVNIANRSIIEGINLYLPPLPEQRAIAHILGALDDKIELNRRMNETLEGIAHAIFKSWFIDFDPVRAKAEGRETGLPPNIADMFPDEFVESELGEIPRGWSLMTLGDIVEFAYGKGLKEENRKKGHIPVFGSNGQVGWHDSHLVNGPGIIIGRKGNPGIVTWVHTDFFPIDTTFYVVPRGEITSIYYLFYILSYLDLASLGADSAVPGLNRNIAYISKMLIPSSALIVMLDKFVKPLYNRIEHCQTQSRTLASLRDTLLPRLISGKLRIPDAERILGSAL